MEIKVNGVSFRDEATDEEKNEGLEDEFGVLYSKDGKKLLGYSLDCLEDYTVREGTEIICADAFRSKKLKHIVMPVGLVLIGDRAFGRSRLEEIILPVGLFAIGFEAFYAVLLEKIRLPEGLTEIGEKAFGQCVRLQNVVLPESLTTLGAGAFYGCGKLKSIELPSRLGDTRNPFLLCKHINISSRSPAFKFEDDFLIHDGKLVSYTGDDLHVKVPYGITSIGPDAFRSREMYTVELPPTVMTIEEYAFCCCEDLGEIKFSEGLSVIENSAFAYCWSLGRGLKLPSTLTVIGDEAFIGCEFLGTVLLPKGLTSIGEGAFYYCSALYFISLPEGLTSIGEDAFSSDINLECIYIDIEDYSNTDAVIAKFKKLLPESLHKLIDTDLYPAEH